MSVPAVSSRSARVPKPGAGPIADSAPPPAASAAIEQCRDLVARGRLAEAGALLLPLLQREESPMLAAAATLIAAHMAHLATLPPLLAIGRHPLRIDERGPAMFHDLLSLLSQQDTQIRELQATLGELI